MTGGNPRNPMQELIRGRPAQDQRRSLCRVDAWWHANHTVRAERSIPRVRTRHGQIGNAVTDRERRDVCPDLTDLAHDVVPEHQRRFLAKPRVLPFADDDVRELHARSEHAHAHFVRPDDRHGLLDHGEAFDAAEPAQQDHRSAEVWKARWLRYGGPRKCR